MFFLRARPALTHFSFATTLVLLVGTLAFGNELNDGETVEAALAEAERAYKTFAFERCVQVLEPWGHAEAQVEIYLGLCEFFLQHRDNAEKHFEAALRRDPEVSLPPTTSPKIQAVFSDIAARLSTEHPSTPALPPSPAAPPPAAVLRPEVPHSARTRLWFRWSAAAIRGGQRTRGASYVTDGATFNDFAIGVEHRFWKAGGGLLELGRSAQRSTAAAQSAVSTGLLRVSLAPWVMLGPGPWFLHLSGGYRLGQVPVWTGTAQTLSLEAATWNGLFGRATFSYQWTRRLSADVTAEYAHSLGPLASHTLTGTIANASAGVAGWWALVERSETQMGVGAAYVWESLWRDGDSAAAYGQRAHQLRLALRVSF